MLKKHLPNTPGALLLDKTQSGMKKWLCVVVILLSFQVGLSAQQINELEFTGLKRTKEKFLRRLVKVKIPAPFDSLTVATDIERLKRLPGIASASHEVTPLADGSSKLTYAVVENFTIIPGAQVFTANNGEFAFRLALFEFNFLGNNQLLGAFYQRDVFDSFGAFYNHPFLFSDKLGIQFSYQNRTSQEPVFFSNGDKDYRFQSKVIEGAALFFPNFHNEAELGVSLVDESYDFIGEEPIPGAPFSLQADKLSVRALYRYVDVDIDYQYFDGITSEFTGQYFGFQRGSEQAEIFLDDFLSLRNDVLYYKKVKTKGNWASRLRLGASLGNLDSPFAPFTLDNQLNIRGVGNTVDRGIAAVVFNTEYRHTFYEKGWFAFQGNAFIDAGTWRNPGEEFSELFSGRNTRLYPGLGVRFVHKTIFNAVFRLDYGFGIGDNATQGLVFGIGQYF